VGSILAVSALSLRNTAIFVEDENAASDAVAYVLAY
jgi:hypothetical protein